MTAHDAAYTNTDTEYRDICAFLNRLSSLAPHMMWEAGRMNFWRYNVHATRASNDQFFGDNVHIWRSEQQEIVGLAISEYGANDVFVELNPGMQVLFEEMLDWVEQQWAANRSSVEIDVFSDDAVRISRLEARGFSFSHHFENKRFYALADVSLDYVLEEGFAIKAFSGAPDFESRVDLVRNAFANAGYTEQNLRSLMASPDYIDEYHLVVVAPDGQHVAYCIGWNDPVTAGAGYIEPVGTHDQFRKRGFAKAMIKECFSRMRANGIETVDIASRAEPSVSNYLYDSLSPRVKREVHKYVKRRP